jgi:hypothetical protein
MFGEPLRSEADSIVFRLLMSESSEPAAAPALIGSRTSDYDYELHDALKAVFPTVNFHFVTIFIRYPPPPEEDLVLFEVEVFDIYAVSLRTLGL